MADGCICNHSATLRSHNDGVGDVLAIKGDIVQCSPGEGGSDRVRVG